jgi:hypothetical protein
MVAIIWPKILDLEKARKMIRRGVWLCLIIGGTTIIASFYYKNLATFAYAAFWILIAWGIKRKSIWVAALGLAGILYGILGVWPSVKAEEDLGLKIFSSICGYLLYIFCFFILIGSIRGIKAHNEFEAKMKTSIDDSDKTGIATESVKRPLGLTIFAILLLISSFFMSLTLIFLICSPSLKQQMPVFNPIYTYLSPAISLLITLITAIGFFKLSWKFGYILGNILCIGTIINYFIYNTFSGISLTFELVLSQIFFISFYVILLLFLNMKYRIYFKR